MASVSTTNRPAVLSDLLPGARVRDAALVVGTAALTGLAAQVSFYMPGNPVPLTLQTFAVIMAGAVMGAPRAALGMGLYMLAGLAGVPWFADGAHGYPAATFGYLLGFIVAGALIGAFARRGGDRTPLRTIGTMAAGSLVIYAFGLPWLMAATGMDLATAFAMGVVPFLLLDGLKIVAAALLLPAAWKLTRR